MSFNSLLKASVTAALLIGSAGALADGTANFASDISVGGAPDYTLSTAQGGQVYGYNSCFQATAPCIPGSPTYDASNDWHYYYSPAPWYVTEFDEFALMEGTYGPIGAPGIYYGLTLTSPNTLTKGVAQKMSASDAKYVLVKMGNYCGPIGCKGPTAADVLTIVLSNGTKTTTLNQDPHTDSTVTALCSASVTLAGTGDGIAVGDPNSPPYPPGTNRLHAMFTYKVDMKQFKCSKGTLAKATSGLTAVSVEVRQDKNVNAMNVGDELEMIAVSRVSFGK
jgi:hypothetical protein